MPAFSSPMTLTRRRTSDQSAMRLATGRRSGVSWLGALEVAHDELLVLVRARSEREAAVAHHDAGDAVPARARPERIPEDLGVHVRVAVDEARGHHAALGVEHLARALADAADGGDTAVLDSHVGAEAGKTGAVDHRAVLDHQVVRHSLAPLNGSRGTAGRLLRPIVLHERRPYTREPPTEANGEPARVPPD